MRANKNAYRLLFGKRKGKRSLGRPRRRLVNNMKLGSGGMNWNDLAQDRGQWNAFVNMVMKFRVL
jgi:hypothetical protein